MATNQAIDKFIKLERRLERCTSQREEEKLIHQLGTLEVIDGVTRDDVRRRRREITKR